MKALVGLNLAARALRTSGILLDLQHLSLSLSLPLSLSWFVSTKGNKRT